MRTLLLIFALMISAKSQAEIRQPGAFIPSACGVQSHFESDDPAERIEKVCIGNVATAETQRGPEAIRFRYENGDDRIMLVTRHETVSAHALFPFEQLLFELETTDDQPAMMRMTIGNNGQQALTGRVGHVAFFVPRLEPVAVTLGN